MLSCGEKIPNSNFYYVDLDYWGIPQKANMGCFTSGNSVTSFCNTRQIRPANKTTRVDLGPTSGRRRKRWMDIGPTSIRVVLFAGRLPQNHAVSPRVPEKHKRGLMNIYELTMGIFPCITFADRLRSKLYRRILSE